VGVYGSYRDKKVVGVFVRFCGPSEEALNKLSNCDLIYISFDVDSMDCDMISWYRTPVPKV
jgi:hypothetical protein